MRIAKHDRIHILELFIRGWPIEALQKIYDSSYRPAQIEAVIRAALKKISGGEDA